MREPAQQGRSRRTWSAPHDRNFELVQPLGRADCLSAEAEEDGWREDEGIAEDVRQLHTLGSGPSPGPASDAEVPMVNFDPLSDSESELEPAPSKTRAYAGVLT